VDGVRGYRRVLRRTVAGRGLVSARPFVVGGLAYARIDVTGKPGSLSVRGSRRVSAGALVFVVSGPECCVSGTALVFMRIMTSLRIYTERL
jgi:hypothetical protein